jgi:hypothetical protein
MLDIILRTRIYPFGASKDLGGVISAIRASITSNKTDFVSAIDKRAAKAEADIKDIISAVEAIQ